MAISRLISMNEKYIEDALNNGLSSDGVLYTLEGILNKSDQKGVSPKQIKETIEYVASMKNSYGKTYSENYLSNLVNQNADRIKAALNDGISPTEIANTLINSIENANDRVGKEKLGFVVRLVSEIKKKEYSLHKSYSDKGVQKIKTNNKY